MIFFQIFCVALFFLAPIQGFSSLTFSIAEEGDSCDEKLPHECGIAFVRLRKPISHYIERYRDPAWGMKKLLSLMEKQRNRGQDGAGVAAVQFNMPSGQEYLQHLRSAADNAIESIFGHIVGDLNRVKLQEEFDEIYLKRSSPFIAESLLGHVRYATHSGIQLKNCQP